jgi:hypothetical protein
LQGLQEKLSVEDGLLEQVRSISGLVKRKVLSKELLQDVGKINIEGGVGGVKGDILENREQITEDRGGT